MGSRARPAASNVVTPTKGAPVSTVLRPVHADDLEAIAAIEQVAFSDPWSASAFADLMTYGHARTIVALDAAGEVLGYCVLLHVLDEGEIANIAVAPAFRGRGIAARLLDDALGAAVRMGLRSVFLEVRLSNEAARGLYGSRGFSSVGRRRGYYQDPLEDALILRWNAQASSESHVAAAGA